MRHRFLIGFALVALMTPVMGADTDAGVDLTAMDRSVIPGNNFYGYANGSWIKRTQIPPDQSRWGGFSVLGEQVRNRTRALIEDAVKSAPRNSEAAKVGDFYASFTD